MFILSGYNFEKTNSYYQIIENFRSGGELWNDKVVLNALKH